MLELIPHGAAVHFPVALGVLFPLFFFGVLWAERRRKWSPDVWIAVALVSVIQIVSILLADQTGERAEFFSTGANEAIERHEELAEVFTWLWVAITVPLVLRIWLPLARRFAVKLVVGLLLLGQLGLVLYLGKIGGQLAH